MASSPQPTSGDDAADRDGLRPGRVLVVGGSGKTGRAVAGALLRRGARVQVTVRPGREGTAPHGSTPVPLDLDDGAGLGAALRDVDAVYHLAPNVHPGEVGMAHRVAEAAGSSGVRRVVFHSVLHPNDPRMPHHLRKAEAESALRDRIGDRLVVLRPAAYHQNLLDAVLTGAVTVPYSLDARFTNVDLGDVAEVAAGMLLSPGHGGEVHDLVGPEEMTTREMARTAVDVLGREVRARSIPLAQWSAGPGAALPTAARTALEAMFAAYEEDGLTGDPRPLADLLGRRPTSWAETVRRAATTSGTAGGPATLAVDPPTPRSTP